MGKLLVISGGTKGIGRAIINRFASDGFDVITCSRNAQDLDELKRDIESHHHVKVMGFEADLTRRSSVSAFVQSILQQERPITVLVNNAGYFVPGKITEEPEGTLETMLNANLVSAYHLTRGLVESMKAEKGGHIFNMCSVASLFAYPNGGSYSITKFALLGFSKVLREELKATGIRVTAVLPGATRTASWDGVDLPEDRFIRSEDVAETVFSAFSLSPRAVVEEVVIRPQLGDI